MGKLKSEAMRLDPDQEWVTFRLGLILVIFIALFYIAGMWSRETFTILNDSGRTLYAPTLILKGRALYRDFDWMYAPLSPYLEAFLYRMAGIHFEVLQAWGCLLFFIILVSFYLVGATLFSPIVALVFYIPFILASDCWIGFVPYSFSATYGNVTSILAFWLLILHSRDSKPWRIAVAGIFLGLCIASKLEFGLSSFVGSLAYLTLRREKLSAYATLIVSTAVVGLTPYLLLLRCMPATTLLSQLFPFWLARLYHGDLLKQPKILCMPLFSWLALLLTVSRSDSINPSFIRKPYREAASGFCIFSVLLSMRALQGSWCAQCGPSYLLITAILIYAIRWILQRASHRRFEFLLQPALLLYFFNSVYLMMGIIIETQVDLPWRIQSPRMHALCLRYSGERLNRIMGFLKHQRYSKNLIAMPYMPIYNYLAEMDSPIPRLFYLQGFLPDRASQETAIRQLEKAGGAWIIVSRQYDDGQPGGFGGYFFGLNFDRDLWIYLRKNYATYAVWKDQRLVILPGTPVGWDNLAILAPRKWRVSYDSIR